VPQLAAQVPYYGPPIGFYRGFGKDEAVTSQDYAEYLDAAFSEIYRSAFWHSKDGFAEARRQLKATASLARGWDTYGAEPPNEAARALAGEILDALEADLLPPTRLMPSSEGGIAMSFVEGDNRAEIEIYNSGEVAVATYSAHSEPVVYELSDTDAALKHAIIDIRVHLAA
jgi:hypothetical protein